jgi:hypothetical protein
VLEMVHGDVCMCVCVCGSSIADESMVDGKALRNTDYSFFNAETCRLLMSLFDTNRSGSIDFGEFSRLWDYVGGVFVCLCVCVCVPVSLCLCVSASLRPCVCSSCAVTAWKRCFDRFDSDRSGSIDRGELLQAFRANRYELPIEVIDAFIRKFGASGACSTRSGTRDGCAACSCTLVMLCL